MLKAIFLFIKAHAVLTAVTTTVVVGIAVVTPIAVSNYMLDKNVKENLSMLAPSDFRTNTHNQETENNQEQNNEIENNQTQNESKPVVNPEEPLEFRIERVFHEEEDGYIVVDDEDDDIYQMKGESAEYKIIPSYDKEYSKWTKEEKKAYQKAYEDVAKIAEKDYQNNMLNEQKAMQETIITMEKVTAAESKEYRFSRSNGWPEFWIYNSYTKLYRCGTVTQTYGEKVEKTVRIKGTQSGTMTGVIKQDFREIVYPSLKKDIEDKMQQKLQRQIKENPAGAENPQFMKEFKKQLEEEKQNALKDLEELYHLSD